MANKTQEIIPRPEIPRGLSIGSAMLSTIILLAMLAAIGLGGFLLFSPLGVRPAVLTVLVAVVPLGFIGLMLGSYLRYRWLQKRAWEKTLGVKLTRYESFFDVDGWAILETASGETIAVHGVLGTYGDSYELLRGEQAELLRDLRSNGDSGVFVRSRTKTGAITAAGVAPSNGVLLSTNRLITLGSALLTIALMSSIFLGAGWLGIAVAVYASPFIYLFIAMAPISRTRAVELAVERTLGSQAMTITKAPDSPNDSYLVAIQADPSTYRVIFNEKAGRHYVSQENGPGGVSIERADLKTLRRLAVGLKHTETARGYALSAAEH